MPERYGDKVTTSLAELPKTKASTIGDHKSPLFELNGDNSLTKTDAVKVDEKIVLKRKLTLMNGVAIIVGTIIGIREREESYYNINYYSLIGSGIFIAPTGVFFYTG